jgi:tetratricopeptide (TPR) repeat protein
VSVGRATRLFAAALLLTGLDARAADRILNQMETGPSSIIVQFNCAMSYVSHYPLRTGSELRIELQPMPGCVAPANFSEMLPVPENTPGLVSLSLELGIGTRRALILKFSRSVDYVVRPQPGLTAIEVAVRRQPSVQLEAAEAPATPARPVTRPLPPQADLDALATQARAAMQAKDYDLAIRCYTKLLEYPEHSGRAQAQEFLGLARERKGELAQAKLEYQEYLKRYPDGQDADQVRQRLAALVTLEGASEPTRGAPDGSRWQFRAAIDQEYRHDENSITTQGTTANGIGQSALISDADLLAHHRGQSVDFGARLNVGYINNLVSGSSGSAYGSNVRLAAAYAELDDTQSHWSTRAGRQSQTVGGVYGTFDGLYFGYRVTPGVRLNFSAGAPVETYSATFSTQRVFGSVSADFIGVAPGLDLTGFALEQQVEGYLDERQLGAELRYYRNGNSLVAQVDYDLSYQLLNAATLLGTWNLPARWVMTGIWDHREAPFIATYNSLIGQPTTSVQTLVDQYGLDQVRQLARDRTAKNDTATLGLQRPLGERVQWWNDVTWSRLAGTPASGGVPAVPSPGEYVTVSTQLLGGGWLASGDMNVVGLSYASQAGTHTESAFINARYALGARTSLGPRLNIDKVTGATSSSPISNGWSASPSLLGDWRFRSGLIEIELGYSQSAQTLLPGSLGVGGPAQPGTVPPPGAAPISQQTRRFWFSVGYNVSF